MKALLESIVGGIFLALLTLWVEWETLQLARKYKLAKEDKGQLFFYLLGFGSPKKIIRKYPVMFQKEFPSVWAAFAAHQAQLV